MGRVFRLAAAMGGAFAVTGIRAEAQQVALESCEVRGVEGPARCGGISVPEDPAGQRMIRLNLTILPATEPNHAPDPLFYLAGGPGQAATDLAPVYGRALAALRRTRDLVFIDQRGTGRSSPLPCRISEPEQRLRAMMAFEFPDDRLAECLHSYEAALAWYGTTQTVADIERVRAALGYDRVNLLGASYGTRVALTYIRTHPDRVRSAVLAGVAPPSFHLGESFAADADSALAGLGRECAAQPACAEITPDLVAMTRATADRLEASPASAAWARGADTIPIRIDRTLFVGGTRFLLYSGPLVTGLPRVVRAAHDGDFAPFLSTIGRFADLLDAQLATGLFLSVACTEDVDPIDSARHAEAAASTLLRTVGVRGLMRACRDWPRGATPPDFFDRVTASVPTLMFSGADDPITPPWHAAQLAGMMPNARHVIIPNASHVDLQACEFGIIGAFIASASAADLDVGCSTGRPPRFGQPAGR